MLKIKANILENEQIRLLVEEKEGHAIEKIQVKEGDDWISLLGSNHDHSTLNFWWRNHIYSKPLSFRKRTKKKLYYDVDDEDIQLNLDYCLEENNIFHIRYKMSNNRQLFLSKMLVNYAILLGGDPDFTWSPHLRPDEGLVIGDHVYRSPAVIYKKGKHAIAFMPDLKTLRQNHPFQSILDFNLKPSTFKGSPQIAYGFGNYKPTGHILFKHNPNKLFKIKENTNLTFRYYIIIFIDKSEHEILEFINDFLWKKYGTKLLSQSLAPQVLPYDVNAKEGFKAIFDRHEIWGDFKLNGEECGGFWQTSWMGKRKSKVNYMDPGEFSMEKQMKQNMTKLVSAETFFSKIIMYFANSPFWIKRFEWFTQTFPVIKRNAEQWFNAWFNNMRSAYGFRYFGELWNDEDLKQKGDKILNSLLSVERKHGVNPSVILPGNKGDGKYSIIKGLQGFLYVDDYSLVDSSLSTYWALKYAGDFDVKKEDVLLKAKEMVELISEIQHENGEIPAYVDFESEDGKVIISDILKGSASSGAPLMLLTEYYKHSKEKKLLTVMEKIANYIENEIIPEDKWHDFEPFYSCTHLPLDFYDDYTKSHVMNGLCIYWCAEGIKELYNITNNPKYLTSGERILAILSLFQQVWEEPYLSINAFGGFCSQNIDAELSDARQGLFIRTYMEYYLLTGKSEYMERGIAALRGSWAMQFLKEYEEECPGNVKKLKTIDGVDRGVVAENYGHSGNDLRVPGYWMADWGFGTSLSATAYVKKHFGDVFLDFKEGKVFGIDGVLINSYDVDNGTVSIDADLISSKKYLIIKARNPNSENIIIILNGTELGIFNSKELQKGIYQEL